MSKLHIDYIHFVSLEVGNNMYSAILLSNTVRSSVMAVYVQYFYICIFQTMLCYGL